MDEAEQENEIKMEEARINAEQEAREAATAAASARKKSAQVQDASGGSNTRGGVASDIRAAFGKARTREGSLPINSATAAAGGHSSGAAGPSSSAGAMVSGAGAGGDKGSMTSAAQRRRTEDLEASKRQREFFEFLQVGVNKSGNNLYAYCIVVSLVSSYDLSNIVFMS